MVFNVPKWYLPQLWQVRKKMVPVVATASAILSATLHGVSGRQWFENDVLLCPMCLGREKLTERNHALDSQGLRLRHLASLRLEQS